MTIQLPFFEINSEPLIVATILDMGDNDLTQKVINHFESQGKNPYYVLFMYHCVENERDKTSEKIHQLFPFNSQYVILSNTEQDHRHFLTKHHISIFCHQNRRRRSTSQCDKPLRLQQAPYVAPEHLFQL